MKLLALKFFLIGVFSLMIVSCGTIGGATRTSKTVYQPTNAASVEILWKEPRRPYDVIGQVRSNGGCLASDDAVYRSMQKEAAELGAHAILIQGQGVGLWNDCGDKIARALAIRYTDGHGSNHQYAVTPTSTQPTTPQAEQIVPKK